MVSNNCLQLIFITNIYKELSTIYLNFFLLFYNNIYVFTNKFIAYNFCKFFSLIWFSDTSIIEPRVKNTEYLENNNLVVFAEVPDDPCSSSKQIIYLDDEILSLYTENLISSEIEIIDISNYDYQYLSHVSLNKSSLSG